MLPYVLLLIIPFIFSFVSLKRVGENGRIGVSIVIGRDEYTKNHNLSILLFFVLFFLLLALRHPTLGRDLVRYEYYFDEFRSLPFTANLKFKSEIVYQLLNWIIGNITDNFQIFLVVVAALCVIPIAYVNTQDREHSYLAVILFVNMSTFIMAFSGLRQMLAVSIGMIAYEFVKKKKLLPYLLMCVLAMGFHHASFILFILYPVYYMRLTRKKLKYAIPIFAVVYAFNGRIFGLLAQLVSFAMNGKNEVEVENNGAISFLLLLLAMSVVSYMFTDDDNMDMETMGLRNILVVSTFLQSFASVHLLAMRVNYFFIILIPYAMVKIIKNIEQKAKKEAFVIELTMVVFLTAYYLYTTYISCKTGISALDTYPYRAFWS